MPRRPNINEFGLNCAYYHSQLTKIKRDMSFYRPDELARALVRLAYVADPQVAVNTAQQLELDDINCGE